MLDPVMVGKVIQKYREEKRLSQEEAGGFADINHTHLSAIERGERRLFLKPSIASLKHWMLSQL